MSSTAAPTRRESIAIRNYEFRFEQQGSGVSFLVRNSTGNMTDGDKDWIDAWFGDMGKWETSLKALTSIADDLGISNISDSVKERYAGEYNSDNYVVEFTRMREEFLEGRVSLSQQEYRLRALGLTDPVGEDILSIDEISLLSRNVEKWRALCETCSWLFK